MVSDACSTAYYADVALLPRATGMARYRRRPHTVVSLFCGEWPVAKMLVESFAFFVEAVPTWIETIHGGVRWRADDYQDGAFIATWRGTSTTAMLPTITSWKKALSFSRARGSWTTELYAKVAGGGTPIAMPPTYEGIISALVVHKVIPAKHREPVVEAYVVPWKVNAGKPILDPYLCTPMRVVLAFHDVVSLAVNSRVWALTSSSLDGSLGIARVLPRRLAPISAKLADEVPNTDIRTCEGLDVLLANGKRQDLLETALYSKPRRPKPRKRWPTRLYNGVYPERV